MSKQWHCQSFNRVKHLRSTLLRVDNRIVYIPKTDTSIRVGHIAPFIHGQDRLDVILGDNDSNEDAVLWIMAAMEVGGC